MPSYKRRKPYLYKALRIQVPTRKRPPEQVGYDTSCPARRSFERSSSVVHHFLPTPGVPVVAVRLSLPIRGCEVRGYRFPDDLKFRSLMTLFAAVAPAEESHFVEALQKYFGGQRDLLTTNLLGRNDADSSK